MRVWLSLAAALVALITWSELLAFHIVPLIEAGMFPTSTYWVAPRLVLLGRTEILFDIPAFAAAAVELGALPDRGFLPNAPVAVLPLLPLGLLAQAPAFAIWTTLSIASAAAATTLVAATIFRRRAAVLVALAVLPLYVPLRHNLLVGQAFTFVLLAVALGMALQARPSNGRLVASGLLYGVAAAIKSFYGLALIGVLVLHRRWRAAMAAAAFLLAAGAAAAALVGAQSWAVWMDAVLSWRARPETSLTAYQTLTSLFGHLLRYDQRWNPAAVADLPLLADLLWLACALLIGLVTAVAIARTSTDGLYGALLSAATVIPAAVLLSPIAEDYHYVLLLLPLIVAAGALAAGRRWHPGWLVLALCVLLLALPWQFNQPVDGWRAVLHYPRVYGALVLWALTAWLAWHQPGRHAAPTGT